MLGHLRAVATNEITTKMASNEVNTINVEAPVRVPTKNPKKVEQGKRLAEWNCKSKEKLAQPDKAQKSKSNSSQAYSVGAVIAVRRSWLLHLPKR